MNIKLSEKAMLVKFSRSAWPGKREDKQITQEVNTQHGATDAGKFNKYLIDPAELKPGQKAGNEARTFFYAQSLPWNDEGWRLLPTTNFFHLTQEMRTKLETINNIDADFLTRYPALIESRKAQLNGLWKATDYPSIDRLTRKFSTSLEFQPIPESDAARFLDGITQEEIEKVEASYKARVEASVQGAMTDLWERLFKTVEHLSETLKDPGAKFKDSIIENIVELCAIMPRLNLTRDQDLETMRSEALNRLTRFEPEQLRPDNAKDTSDRNRREAARKETARAADDILKAMGAFYTPAQE